MRYHDFMTATSRARTTKRSQALPSILDVLEEHPGMSVTRLADEVGLSQPETTRALQALAEAGDLERVGADRYAAYVLPEDVPEIREPGSMEGLTAIERRRAILDWIAGQRVSPTQGEMAQALGIAATTLASDVRLLIAGGALAKDERLGGRRNLRPGPQVEAWVDPMRNAPRSGGVKPEQ